VQAEPSSKILKQPLIPLLKTFRQLLAISLVKPQIPHKPYKFLKTLYNLILGDIWV
jgi:hypothetical protein